MGEKMKWTASMYDDAADRLEDLVGVVAAATQVEMLRDAARLIRAITQPAQAVDVEKVREVIAELREADSPSPLRFREWADKLTAALPNANGKEG